MCFLARLLGREHYKRICENLASISVFCLCHRVSLQELMEVTEKDSQRIERGKGGRKKCRCTFSIRFMITRLFNKRRSSEDFKYDLAKATKA